MGQKVNRVIAEKLTALRTRLEEAHPASYASRMMDADEKFLEQVAKNLKTALGSKISDIKVHRGSATVFLSVEGEDASDFSLDLTLALHTKSWTDVEVMLDGKHAMKGTISRRVGFKTGELTPAEAAAMVLEQFK